jgi:hypothetical protein
MPNRGFVGKSVAIRSADGASVPSTDISVVRTGRFPAGRLTFFHAPPVSVQQTGRTRLEAGVYFGKNFEKSAFWFPDLVKRQFTDSNFRRRMKDRGWRIEDRG